MNGQKRSNEHCEQGRDGVKCVQGQRRSKTKKTVFEGGLTGVRISDIIAGFIDDMINETGGSAELQRAELASRFKCVPSQINYVISTRFSPEHGYVVESRRGGGGFIKITRVEMEPEMLTMHTVNAIGDNIDLNTAVAMITNLRQNDIINDSEARLMLSAIGNNAMRIVMPIERNALRANILKQMLISL